MHIIDRYQVAGNGDRTIAILPRDYKFDGTKTGILFAWGYGNNRDMVLDPAKGGQPFLFGLVDAGYPVVVSELGNPTGSTNQWGNATAKTRLTQAKTFLQSPTINAKAGKVAVAGFSMGAQTVMSWARENVAQVHSIAGFCPVSNLDDIHSNATYTASIDTAWGGTYTDAEDGAEANPTIFGATLAGIPTRLWYAFNDTVVPQATVQNLATVIGSSAQAIHAGGFAHNWTLPAAKLPDYVAFLRANGA